LLLTARSRIVNGVLSDDELYSEYEASGGRSDYESMQEDLDELFRSVDQIAPLLALRRVQRSWLGAELYGQLSQVRRDLHVLDEQLGPDFDGQTGLARVTLSVLAERLEMLLSLVRCQLPPILESPPAPPACFRRETSGRAPPGQLVASNPAKTHAPPGMRPESWLATRLAA
jgi:hypothetical protein